MPSGTTVVPAGANTITVTGSFGANYQAVAQPAWNATADIPAATKVPSQFVLNFSVPAPPGGSTVDWIVVTALGPTTATPRCITAGTLLTRMRAKIVDSVFAPTGAGTPQPEMDGKFRAQTLYGWFDDATQVLTQITGWTLADWWAMAQVQYQPFYDVDARWSSVESAFSNQWPLDVMLLDESDTIWPNNPGQINTQSLSAYVRRLGSNLQVGLWPTPNATDPITTLVNPITDSDITPIMLASVANFLSYGYVQIDNEILAYQFRVNTLPGISVITRGIGGTTQAAHEAGAGVQHLGFWMKGRRVPTPIVNSLSCVEVPRGWISHLETYVLGQVRMEQKRFAEGDKLLANFERACDRINADPNWKVNRGLSHAFGDPPLIGGVYWPRSGGVIVP